MTGTKHNGQDFIDRLTEIVEANLQNEQFGVEELAREMSMSRSSLHRRITEAAKIPANQFICQVRLKKALKMLRETSMTVSETAYECGFHSATYFSKCFRDYYGYSPGEVSNRNEPEPPAENYNLKKTERWKKWLIPSASLIIFSLIIFIISESAYFRSSNSANEEEVKTIAMLPLKFEGSDSMQILAGGFTEAVLNRLMEIENLVIRSKTSVEQYRETTKPLKEIAKELKTDYVIETNARQYGNNLYFQINIAEAENDIYLLRESYNANIKEENFLDLQMYMAIDIIDKTRIKLAPGKNKQLEQRLTENPAALRFYLMGLHHLELKKQKETLSNWEDHLAETYRAKSMFEKAIQQDSGFSAAYVRLGQIFINVLSNNFRESKNAYLDSGLVMAERAISLYDKQEKDRDYYWALGVKSNYYMYSGNLEKARFYADESGKSGWFDYGYYSGQVYKYYTLEDYYQVIKSFYKYLELKPEEENIPLNLLSTISYDFFHAGFPEMGEKYLLELLKVTNDSLHYFFQMCYGSACNFNYDLIRRYANKCVAVDSSFVYPIFWMGWTYVYVEDYPNALEYVRILERKTTNGLFPPGMAFVHLKTGNRQKALGIFEKSVKNYLEQIETGNLDAAKYYPHYYLAVSYSAMDEKEKALHYLKEVNNRPTIPVWIINALKMDPMFDNIRNEPEFHRLVRELEKKYQKEHKRIAMLLKQKGEI